MEKLIELLNEYEVEKKPSRLKRNYYLGFVHNFGKGIMYIDEEGEDVDDYRTDYEIISKEYGFIKWLVDNDKIDVNKVKKEFYNNICITEYGDEDRVMGDDNLVIAVLSISDSPIKFLCSILK